MQKENRCLNRLYRPSKALVWQGWDIDGATALIHLYRDSTRMLAAERGLAIVLALASVAIGLVCGRAPSFARQQVPTAFFWLWPGALREQLGADGDRHGHAHWAPP